MKKYISKIIGICFLVLGVILGYLIISDQLDHKVENLSEQVKSYDNDDNAQNAYKVSKEQPEGIIYDLKDAFVWKAEPSVDTYDPENKIGKNEIYGVAMDSVLWQDECMKSVYELMKNQKIDEDKSGMDIYSLRAVHEMNEKVEIIPYNRTVEVTNLRIYDDISEFDEEYFTKNRYEDNYTFIKRHLESGDKASAYQYDEEKNELYTEKLENGTVKLITVDIKVDAYSNWIEDELTVPRLILASKLEDKIIDTGEILYTFGEDKEFNDTEDFDISDAVYFDIGLYDLKHPGQNAITHYPMRKGESLKFTCGYFIPECLLPDCMLKFYTPYYTEHTYYNPYQVLVSLNED